jgi:outer membrane lipopolysaccharide assembly protein LptE/RlpB
MILRNATLLTLVCLLVGCGFQLRGAGFAQHDLTYRLVSDQPNSASLNSFQRTLKLTLGRARLSEGSDPDLILVIDSFQLKTTDGAVDAQIRVAEQVASISMALSVQNDEGEMLVDGIELGLRGAYRIDRSQLLGSYEQRSRIEKNLYQNLADQVVRTIHSLILSHKAEPKVPSPDIEG